MPASLAGGEAFDSFIPYHLLSLDKLICHATFLLTKRNHSLLDAYVFRLLKHPIACVPFHPFDIHQNGEHEEEVVDLLKQSNNL